MPVRSTPRPQVAKIDTDVLRDIAIESTVASGAAVERRRKELKMHRRELAQLSNSTEPTIIRIETGALNPKDHLRMAIAAALACEVSTLWSYPSLRQIMSRAAA